MNPGGPDAVAKGDPGRTAPLPWAAWPIVRPAGRLRLVVGSLLTFAVLAPLTWSPPRHSGNVFSRYMTIESIVDRGTLAIERSPLLGPSGSPDVVRFGPHLYSDKPPVLPALAAPIYAGLRAAGLRFTGPGAQFVACNFALTWLVSGLSTVLAVASIRSIFQAMPIRPAWADVLAATLAVGSPLLTYAVTFNNHSVAAGLIASAVALTVLERPGPSPPRARRFAVGLCAGLAAVVDLPAGSLFLAGLGIIQAVRSKGVPRAFAAGAAGPLLLHCGLQSLVTGSPLPAEMYPGAFNYPGSYWSTPEGTWKESGPRAWFGLDLLVGRQGFFTVMPALWFAAFGLAASVVRPSLSHLRPLATLVAGSTLVLVGYYVWGVRRTDFAGSSFGVRHLLPLVPLLFAFATLGAAEASRRLGAWVWVLFAASAAIGAVYAAEGMVDPWSRVERRAESDPILRGLQVLVPYRGGTYRDGIAPGPQDGPAGRGADR